MITTTPWLRQYQSKKGHQVFIRVRLQDKKVFEIPVYYYVKQKKLPVSVKRENWKKGFVTGGSYNIPADEINSLMSGVENDIRDAYRVLSEKKIRITRRNILRQTYIEKEKECEGSSFRAETVQNTKDEYILDYWADFVRNYSTYSYNTPVRSISEYIARTGDNCRAVEYSDSWLERYFKDLVENGYSLRKDGSERRYYTIPTIIKYLKHLHKFGNYLFHELKILDNQNYLRYSLSYPDRKRSLLKYKNEQYINAHALSKKEFDWFFGFRFADKQKEQARDMFILQTWLGGLRQTEFYDIMEIKAGTDAGGRYNIWYESANGRTEILNATGRNYVVPILERYPGGFSIYLKPYRYNLLLKSAAKAAGLERRIKFSREIINDIKPVIREVPIFERISNKWARNCAVSILTESGFPDELICRFIHTRSSALISHFRQSSTLAAGFSDKVIEPEIVTGARPKDLLRVFRVKGTLDSF